MDISHDIVSVITVVYNGKAFIEDTIKAFSAKAIPILNISLSTEALPTEQPIS